MNPLDRAISAAGGVTKLATSIGQRSNTVGNWRLRGQVPAQHCAAIEAATGVSRHELRPDVFGPVPANEESPPSHRSQAA